MESSKSIVILGCGYVGAAMAEQALARGMHVIALTRNADKAAGLRAKGVQCVVEADLGSDDWHTQIEPRQDYVFNCVSSGGGGLDGYRKSYVAGQQSLLRWAAKGNIGTVIYTGATSVYSQSDGEIVDEDSTSGDLSPSGEILLEAEKVLSEGAAAAKIARWFVLRLGGIYGPGRHYLLDKLRAGETAFPGSGDFYVNMIHRDDIVSAAFALFQSPEVIKDRIYNLVDGDYPSKSEMVEWLADRLSVGKPHFDPSQSMNREGRRRNTEGKLPNRRVSTERIRSELNWKPTYPSFRDGYEEILAGS
ncbi:NAD-dependent epimerase/dehydratase family protein [Rubellicoccus peritrichatus]|uniref:NAD-dependent epimerase/dehydratase family protein n=1 Tax=Rubellicoccus peritrichatus TaxID=3080537 RepID=A0AAQ3QSI3_9BACT|nr:NAD-dependent epimerase/dehydratase family protein [Puniceicoccus sp. CR14]WOO42503.1 NAD-dependent epimerase/dehydratase family protein [Puniceicoccus sp. CR14]